MNQTLTCPQTRRTVILFPILFIAMASIPLCKGFGTTSSSIRSNFASQISKDSNKSLHHIPSSSKSTILHSSLSPEITVKTKQIDLSTGISAEIMVCKPPDDKSPLSSLQMVFSSKPKPPLVFIHGSFHASWCWAEKFFPYFANLGYPCYALSLRGTGGTFAGEEVNRVNIMDHVRDIVSFLEYVDNGSKTEEVNNKVPPPVLLAHSFGGLAIMKYLEKYLYIDPQISDRQVPSFLSDKVDDSSNVNDYESTSISVYDSENDKLILQSQTGLPFPLSGVCLMCSVPPSGNGKMTMRFLRRSLKDSWKITAGLALKKCIIDEDLCRDLFFGGKAITNEEGEIVQDWGVSDDDIRRYQGYFERDTVATINLKDLSSKLPNRNIDKEGRALFGDAVPPALVLGASDDFIVDDVGVTETAKYFGVDPTIVDSPHDVMLGSKWENAATEISQWLEKLTKEEK